MVMARGDDGQRSAVIVHLKGEPASYCASQLGGGLSDCQWLLKIDEGTGNQIAEAPFNGSVKFDGYGVAVMTTAEPRRKELAA